MENFHGDKSICFKGGKYAYSRFLNATNVNSSSMRDQKSTGLTTGAKNQNTTESFYREYRVYGRLEEGNVGHRVAKYYGYTILTSDQEEQLRRKGVPIRESTDGDTRPPLKVLVKEFIGSKTPFTPRMITRMIRDLQMINKMGIKIFDVRKENYLERLLLEFGSSTTVPHPNLSKEWADRVVKFKASLESLPKADEDDFDQMIDDYNEETTGRRIWKRIGPNWDLQENVLRRTRLDVYEHEIYYPKYRPELYDWEKAERDREAKRERQVNSSKSNIKNMEYVDI